jgi:hypothetical protein
MQATNFRRLIRLNFLIAFLVISPKIECQKVDQTSGGTCAVFLQNGQNLAVAIDSVVTTTINDVRVRQGSLACKLWQPNSDIVAATTGLLDTGPYLTGWDAVLSGKSWTQSLPPEPTEQQVDSALRGWGQQLMHFLAAHLKSNEHRDGEIASLAVAFRTGGKSFFYKERIARYEGKVVRDDEQSVRWPLVNGGSAILYSGSCRNFIGVGGQRAVEITTSESSALENIARQIHGSQINSARQLGDLAMSLEQVLSTISKDHASDQI